MIQVIIVYGTVAFVIIELVGNVYESLQLPDWTPTLVLLLLVIGFPFATRSQDLYIAVSNTLIEIRWIIS